MTALPRRPSHLARPCSPRLDVLVDEVHGGRRARVAELDAGAAEPHGR